MGTCAVIDFKIREECEITFADEKRMSHEIRESTQEKTSQQHKKRILVRQSCKEDIKDDGLICTSRSYNKKENHINNQEKYEEDERVDYSQKLEENFSISTSITAAPSINIDELNINSLPKFEQTSLIMNNLESVQPQSIHGPLSLQAINVNLTASVSSNNVLSPKKQQLKTSNTQPIRSPNLANSLESCNNISNSGVLFSKLPPGIRNMGMHQKSLSNSNPRRRNSSLKLPISAVELHKIITNYSQISQIDEMVASFSKSHSDIHAIQQLCDAYIESKRVQLGSFTEQFYHCVQELSIALFKQNSLQGLGKLYLDQLILSKNASSHQTLLKNLSEYQRKRS